MWGIIPAAGQGSPMQPLAFSKELLPVGSRSDGDGERPRAVSEYLVERLVLGGAEKLCFVISPGKSDILEYYGGGVFSATVFYSVQPHASELFDAVVCDAQDRVLEIQVKTQGPASRWVWGAFKMTGSILAELFALWKARNQQDEYVGTLVNAWIAQGGSAVGV